MVAFHFPPLRGSSGIQRTLRFCQYLPEFGWDPMVLTVNPRAYEQVGDDLLSDVPASVPVERAFALDAARHFAFGGSYPRMLANPDRWTSWTPAAVLTGLRLIRRHRPRAIFSTYPIATAHLIALCLHRITGLPWVADFRDPMAQDDYPADPAVRRRMHRLEASVMTRAARALFTSQGALDACRSRYPNLPFDRFSLLENGYDEDAFAGLTTSQPVAHKRFLVLHSGIVYTSERDPTALFAALSSLKGTNVIHASTFELRFRASANDGLLADLARKHGIDDLVTLAPPLPYREALEEMMSADALLLLQAANCNSQTPAKAYEYLRAARPILALTEAGGDTAALLRRAGLPVQAPLDDWQRIAPAITQFVDDVRLDRVVQVDPAFTRSCSRHERTRELASVLRNVAG